VKVAPTAASAGATPAVAERDERVEAAAGILGELALRDMPLAPLTTYRVGGGAALFVHVRRRDDLAAVAAARHASGLPVLVVGRGSNLLVADAGFVGIALSVADLAGAIGVGDAAVASGDEVVVGAGGGVALPVLARRTAAAALHGFEWAVGVPGSVGGAVKMNAGGHGSDMAACTLDVEVADLAADGMERVRPVDELGLRFRGSDLRDDEVVLAVRLSLRSGDQVAAEAEISEIVRWRRANQPGGQNAGSVFVNPVPGEVSAGSLVDALGLRGFRVGSACVSDKHANFVQASEGGTAADVRAVIKEVRRRVAEATGFHLRSEVRLVGFADDGASHGEGAT